MSSIQCPECGSSIQEGTAACDSCGYPIAQKANPANEINAPAVHSATPQGNPGGQSAPAGMPHSPADAMQINQRMGEAIAMHKSYVGASFGVLFLYFVLYLPGLVLNLVWLSEANRIKKQTGIAPQGTGCLAFLFYIFFAIPLALMVAGVVLTAMGILDLLSFL